MSIAHGTNLLMEKNDKITYTQANQFNGIGGKLYQASKQQ